MNKNLSVFIASKLTGGAKKLFFKARESKTETVAIFGGLMVLAGTVLACTKTKQGVDAWETRKQESQDVEAKCERGSREYLEKQARVWGRFLKTVARIYGPAAALWIAGMISIGTGHVELKKENAQLLLKTAAVKELFDEYRAEVAREIGEEREKELYFGVHEDEVDVLEENPEAGTKRIIRKKVKIFDGNGKESIFARNYSARTSWAFSDHNWGDFILDARITNMQKRLPNVPFITINDLYDELQMKKEFGRCKAGLDWGWVPGDEIVVHRYQGFEQVYDEAENRYYYEPCLRIDFNCRPIRDRIT